MQLELSEILDGKRITSINLYKKTHTLEVFVLCDKLISASSILALEKDLSTFFSVSNILLHVKFNITKTLEEVLSSYWDNIIYLLSHKFSPCKAILHDCIHYVKNNCIFIELKNSASNILKFQNCDKLIQSMILDMFDISTRVTFVDIAPESIDIANYSKTQTDETSTIANRIIQSSRINNTNEKKTPNSNNDLNSKDPSIILGKNFNCSIINMSEVSQDLGVVAISGEIFKVDIRDIKNNRILVIFDITDYQTSLTVKFFAKDNCLELIRQQIQDGAFVKVRGEPQYDKIFKEISIFAKDIVALPPKTSREDTSLEKRVELHLHTQMSSMDGVSSATQLIKRAAAWGHKAIAITDHGVVQAFPDAYEASKKYKIKILYGIECYLLDESTEKNYHTIILVKNHTGLYNLYKIVSLSHINHFKKRPRIPKKLLLENRSGLIVGSACEAGELYRAILRNSSEEDILEIAKFYDYLEIQPLGNNQFLINSGKISTKQRLKDINKQIVNLGKQLQKLVVATCDVHFLDPRDEVFRRILMAGKGFSDADNQAPLYFRTTKEMLAEFDYLGEETALEVVVTNTNKIADLIEEVTPIPLGVFPPIIEGAEEEIKMLAENKAKEIYGENLPIQVRQRMDKELDSIIKNGFSVMYLISQRLVHKSLSDGYLVGSRGSVGSSLVANLIGITEVNSLPAHYICDKCKYTEFSSIPNINCGFDLPDKNCPQCGNSLYKDGYDIPFETFLGFNGDKEPDIDLNFSGEYQPVAHKYVEELFGSDHVYRAGTIGTIAEKTAFGFVKNYFQERNIVTTNAEINRLIKGCSGVKRTTGQHPGGIMIVPQDRHIYEFCPIQRPADDTSSNIITTHFDYHSISGRLLKLDILGHDDPTIIRMLQDLTGVDPKSIPIGEKNTMKLFSCTDPLGISPKDIMGCQTGTLAIPEFGTKFVRQMLVDTNPTTFSELIRISGLSHGTDVWLNNAQTLITSNTATLSEVICTRDDIMLYLIQAEVPSIAAFKIMEDVRKGKGLKPEYEELLNESNIPSWYIDSCNKIKYMFPKAHAAAYVMMAFRIAWFKVYYPECFYTAYFTVRADDFDAELMVCEDLEIIKDRILEFERNSNNLTQKEKNTLTILEIVNEMYARGIKFLPVHLYESDSVKFAITPTGIRPPLNALQGLGTTAAQNILDARANGKFLSIEDIRVRAKVSKTVTEILQKHGCLEGLPESNQADFLCLL